jgi:hypothetical protein
VHRSCPIEYVSSKFANSVLRIMADNLCDHQNAVRPDYAT